MTVAIAVVIDLYKTDPYRPHRRWEESGEGKERCRVVRHVLSDGDRRRFGCKKQTGGREGIRWLT